MKPTTTISIIAVTIFFSVTATFYVVNPYAHKSSEPTPFKPFQLWIVGETELEEATGDFQPAGEEEWHGERTTKYKSTTIRRKYYQVGNKDGKPFFLVPMQ